MRVDISAKLSVVLFSWLAGFLLDWKLGLILLVLLLAIPFCVPAYEPVSERSRKTLGRFLWYALGLSVLLVVVNGIFLAGGGVIFSLFGVGLHIEGVLFGAATATRLLVLSISLLMFFLSTPLQDFVRYLQQHGLPSQLVLVLLLTLDFLDQLPERMEKIFVAQQARGAPVRANMVSRLQSFFALLSPLILSSIVESIERGLALELRGFRRGSVVMMHEETKPVQKNYLVLLVVLLSLLLIAWSIFRWLWG